MVPWPMIYETPGNPAFTDWIVKSGLLREPLRIIDVGCQGGLHPRWRWLGDHLQAWAFDPLPDVIEKLSQSNLAPDRVRYFCMGLGNEDGQRMFSRNERDPFGSSFLPKAVRETDIGRDSAGNLPGYWSRPTIRKLDTLFDERLFSDIDHLKMDCEGFEVEILRGAQRFIERSGVFAVESESHLKLHPWHDPTHFVDLYKLLGPYRFDVYDLHFYRDTRAPLRGGYPNKGRPDTFDFLFLRGFGPDDDLTGHTVDRLIKMMIVAELYALQDVAADILLRASATLAPRLDVAKAMELLRISYGIAEAPPSPQPAPSPVDEAPQTVTPKRRRFSLATLLRRFT
jgi:FkbM family methyltransferase